MRLRHLVRCCAQWSESCASQLHSEHRSAAAVLLKLVWMSLLVRTVHVAVMPAVTARKGVLLWGKLGDPLQLDSSMLRVADALAMDWEHSCRLDVTGKPAHTMAESVPATVQKP